MHALWLRARQAGSPLAQIDVYDQILALRPGDAEALTYKADAALAMDSPEWAVNLCQSALRSDPDYGYAHYQMACAYSRMQQIEDALAHLQAALERNESYQSLAREEEDFQNLREHAEFQRLLSRLDIEVDAAGT